MEQSMDITIHNVEHGSCAVVRHPDVGVIMLDCGHRVYPRWCPSEAYAGVALRHLVITNLDDDHVSDLPNLHLSTIIDHIVSNPSVTAGVIKDIKGEIDKDSGIGLVYQLQRFNLMDTVYQPDKEHKLSMFGYYNSYDPNDSYLSSTNNLSLAMFVRWGEFMILFPGDMECLGWERLLLQDGFSQDLSEVDVLVAPHHGRKSGCCEEAMKICNPDVVIISDDQKQYESQNAVQWYHHRVSGTSFCYSAKTGRIGPRRHVFTTRNDGTIRIDASDTGHYFITYDIEDRQLFLRANACGIQSLRSIQKYTIM